MRVLVNDDNDDLYRQARRSSVDLRSVCMLHFGGLIYARRRDSGSHTDYGLGSRVPFRYHH